MAHFINAKKGIFVQVKPPMKPLAHPDPTPPKQDPLHALNAHLERMPTRWAPLIVKTAVMVPTNRVPMLRSVFQCEKGITNRVQQPKLNVRRVKQEVVAEPCVKIVQKDFFKEEQVKQNVIAAPSAGVTRAMDRPVATQYHRGHTH